MDSLDQAAEVGKQYATQLNKRATLLGSPVRISFDELAMAATRELKRHNVGVVRVGTEFDVSEEAKRAFIRQLISAQPEAQLYAPALERPTKMLSRTERLLQAADQLRIEEETEQFDSRNASMLQWLSARRARQRQQEAALRAAATVEAPPLTTPELGAPADVADLADIREGASLRRTAPHDRLMPAREPGPALKIG
jgi:hypothetical protein